MISVASKGFFGETVSGGYVVDKRLYFGDVEGVFVFSDSDGAEVGSHLGFAVFQAELRWSFGPIRVGLGLFD